MTVPYRCRISGEREELILVSSSLAGRLTDSSDAIDDAGDATVLAAVARTALCVCDIASLVGCSEDEAHRRLERLVARGLAEHHVIDDMNYFTLAGSSAGRTFAAELAREIDA